jgi:hypothetical protein
MPLSAVAGILPKQDNLSQEKVFHFPLDLFSNFRYSSSQVEYIPPPLNTPPALAVSVGQEGYFFVDKTRCFQYSFFPRAKNLLLDTDKI